METLTLAVPGYAADPTPLVAAMSASHVHTTSYRKPLVNHIMSSSYAHELTILFNVDSTLRTWFDVRILSDEALSGCIPLGTKLLVWIEWLSSTFLSSACGGRLVASITGASVKIIFALPAEHVLSEERQMGA